MRKGNGSLAIWRYGHPAFLAVYSSGKWDKLMKVLYLNCVVRFLIFPNHIIPSNSHDKMEWAYIPQKILSFDETSQNLMKQTKSMSTPMH